MTRVASAADAATWLAAQTCHCGARQFARDPALADQGGTLVLRFAGCTRCMQPPYVDARLPEAVERAVAGMHALDPQLVARLGPFITAGFPDYAGPPPESIDTTLVSLGPDWRIAEWLRGSFGYGQARLLRSDGARALATFARPPAISFERVGEQLKLTARGVVPILDLRTAGDYAVLLEAEPTGVSLAAPRFPLVLDLALVVLGKLLDVVADAAQRGEVLRGLRPELVYIDRDLGVGVAPRAERFAMMAPESRDLAPQSPFEALYCGPETVRGTKLTTAYDVFSCCAIFVFLLTRRQPYPGQGYMSQIAAMLQGPPALPQGLDPRTAELIRAGLDPEPTKRPSAREIASAIVVS
jgi:hypothetical protein